VKRLAADPYRDLDVIDARAPRFNQAVIGSLALVAVLTDWWPLLPLLAAQLAVGLTLGRRWCLPCLAYFELVQPFFGEGPIEDARPPRFANALGVAVLGAATAAHAAGLSALGWTLGLLVAGLALLAAATGFCAGCEMYRLGARLRGIRSHRLERIDLRDVGLSPDGEVVVEFTHPLCTDCRALEARLRAEGRRVVTVDVSSRPELARKYGIAVVPTAVTVRGDGAVSARLAG
jgi:thiol-disulfide isomerase/thioredoxin